MIRILTLLLLIPGFGSNAQQDPLYSQYMFNMMLINPAYSGSREVFSATLVNRYQWVGIEGAPKTLSVSVATPLRNKKVVLGSCVYYNSLGPMNNWGILINYTYRLMLGEDNILSFGADVGIRQLIIDWEKITTYDKDDETLLDQAGNALQPDFNFGIFFNANKFYIGLSSRHMFEHTLQAEYNNGIYTIASLARHFYLLGGYAFTVNKHLVLKPSTLVKYTLNIPFQIDISLSALINNILWLGVSYRTIRNTIVFFTEIDIWKKIRIGYSYDIFIRRFGGQVKGSHEIMLNWEFDIYQLRVMHDMDVRYF